MATSSIFASFNIKDRKTAKAFAEALDVSFDAIDIAPINDSTKLMHTLFAMEDFFKLRDKIDEICDHTYNNK